jgi:hypothetical protein
MTSALATSAAAGPSWIADTVTAIKNQALQGGLLGMLQNARSANGSIKSFLGRSSGTAVAFAEISQSNLSNVSSLYAQMASTNMQQARAQKLQDSLNQLSAKQQQVQPKNTLDPFIYLADGSSIDTNSNIMTMSDGTQYDITTGAKYSDPASIMQLANGAYLNTTTNIMTMADGTQIDTVTGQKVSTTA